MIILHHVCPTIGRTEILRDVSVEFKRGKISKDDARKTMEQVGLDPNLKCRVRKYSSGMRRLLGLAQAIMEEINGYMTKKAA